MAPSIKYSTTWGRLEGAIYLKLKLGTAEILTGTTECRSFALPIIQYRAKNSGWSHWTIHGESTYGSVKCEIQQEMGRNHAGRFYQNDHLIAKMVAEQSHGHDWRLLVRSSEGKWELHATPETGIESDVLFSNSDGEIIARRSIDHSARWRDIIDSRFGLGRIRKGEFVNSGLIAEASEDCRVALILLLTAYLCFFEPVYNTEHSMG